MVIAWQIRSIIMYLCFISRLLLTVYYRLLIQVLDSLIRVAREGGDKDLSIPETKSLLPIPPKKFDRWDIINYHYHFGMVFDELFFFNIYLQELSSIYILASAPFLEKNVPRPTEKPSTFARPTTKRDHYGLQKCIGYRSPIRFVFARGAVIQNWL